MNNRVLVAVVAVILATVLVLVAPKLEGHSENENTESITVQEEATTEKVDIAIIQKIDEETLVQEKLSSLDNITDKKEKLLTYKKILKDHPSIIDRQENIYEIFSKEEINLLHKVVQAEIGCGDFDAKVNVANAILNRVYNEGFDNTLTAVLNTDQFTTIRNGTYNAVMVSEDTVLACEYTVLFEDTVDGAVYFESLTSNVHGSYAEEVHNDGYHKFYK